MNQTDVASPQLSRSEEMRRWVGQNYAKEGAGYRHVEYPTEWKNDEDYSLFSSVADSFLGEDESSRWQLAEVFRTHGENFDPGKPEIEIGPLGKKFLGAYQDQIAQIVKQGEGYMFKDENVAHDGMYEGLAKAFNPPEGNNCDNRIVFFAVHSDLLKYHRILAVNQQFMDAKQARVETDNLYRRICRALNDCHFYLESCQRHKYTYRPRSVEKAKNGRLKAELVQGLSEIGEDESPGDNDGLFAYLDRIIESKQPEPVKHFQYWFFFRTQNIVREQQRGPKPIGTGRTGFDKGETGPNPAAPADFSVERDRDDAEENNAKRHVEARSAIESAMEREDLRLENMPKILAFFKRLLVSQVQMAEQVSEFIITRMKKRQEFEENKDDASNDSDKLLAFFPEALRIYCRSAYDQIDILVRPENMRQDANGEIIFKDGRPEVRLVLNKDKTVCVKNLFSLVSPEALDTNLEAAIEKKKRVETLRRKDLTAKQIAKSIGESREFVEDTLNLFRVFETISDGLRKSKRKGRSVDAIAWLNGLTGGRIRNSFAWEWGAILAVLYRPVTYAITSNKDDDKGVRSYFERQRVRLCDPQPGWDGTMQVLSKKTNRPFLKRIYGRHQIRAYKELDPVHLRAFVSLFPVHPYILEGTLPDRFYGKVGKMSPDREMGKRACEQSPGCAWGHNISRLTNESNARMFYDIFEGGFDRKNPKHRIVRLRAARVWQLRRVLRRINGKVEKPRRKRHSDANTEAEYRRAMAMYKWNLHLKKTGPAWRRELLRRWKGNPTCK